MGNIGQPVNQTVITSVKTVFVTGMAAVFHVKMNLTLALTVVPNADMVYKDVIHVMD